MIDLTLLPLHIIDGQERYEYPGLVAANPPRHPGRGRSSDQLIVFFAPSLEANLPPREIQRLVNLLIQTYYKTSGSITAASRAAVDALSQALLQLETNQARTSKEAGTLNLAIRRGTTLYLAHSGSTHTYLLSARGGQHFHEPQSGTAGLGFSSPVALRFFQAEVQIGDRLIFCPNPSDAWASTPWEGSANLDSSDLRKRLLEGVQDELRAAIIQLKPGSGKISIEQGITSSTPMLNGEEILTQGLFRPEHEPVKGSPPKVSTQTSEPVPVKPDLKGREEKVELPEPVLDDNIPLVDAAPAQPTPPIKPNKTTHRSTSLSGDGQKPVSARNPVPAALPDREESPVGNSFPAAPKKKPFRITSITLPVLTFSAGVLRGIRGFTQRTGEGIGNFFPRLLPGRSDQASSLSPLTMAFVAISVPLVIVAIALAVYSKRGTDQQYLTDYNQAVEAAQLTEDQTDPEILRSAWGLALYWLDKAEMSQITSETQALRQQGQQALDRLDAILRLDFQPALLNTLPAGVNITRIVPASTDLYLLNAAQGAVMRAVLTGRGYEIDPSFQCGPGPSGSYIISDLIDIVPMPKGNEFNATILTLDKNGNVLFCGPNMPSTSIPLEPPDANWGKITAIAYQAEILYVLDPQNNAVWVYAGTESFREKPYMFFGKNIPSIGEAVDMTLNAEDLYLLHSDGHLTLCTVIFGAEYTTRCTDPASFTDPRHGYVEYTPIIPETTFTQFQYNQPPDPSIYLLNSQNASIYHFSLRLNLQRVLHSLSTPYNPFPAQPATAFAVGSNRVVFIAFGNQVFHAVIP